MTVSRKVRSSEQLMLLPEFSGPVFKTMAEKRVYFGSVAELIAMKVLGAQQLQIDGRCEICPDLIVLRNQTVAAYAEVKSCGLTGQTIIYKWRHDKEKQFAEEVDVPFVYVVVSHEVVAEKCRTWRELLKAFTISPITVKVLSIHDISGVIESMGPEKQLNKRYDRNHGSCRSGYVGGGWRVRFKDLPASRSVLKFIEIEGFELGLHVTSSSLTTSAALPFDIYA